MSLVDGKQRGVAAPKERPRLKLRRFATLLGLSLTLAGCGLLEGGEPPVEGPARLPAATCTQVNATLQDLQEKVMIEFGAPGEATIEQAAWQAIGRVSRDQIVEALAVKAACAVERPASEQSVTIRSETRDVLTERTVEVWEAQSGE